MKYKSVLVGAAMFLAMVTVGSAKNWNIRLNAAATAGSLQLPAGEYSLKLDGTQAVFTRSDSGRSYSIAVKVENVAKKYDGTTVENTTQGTTALIRSIGLSGTSIKLTFDEPNPAVAAR